MKPKTITILVVVILFVVILFQNSESIEIQLLFWNITRAPVFLLIGITLLIGLLVGWFGHMVYASGKRSKRSAPVQQSPGSPPAADISNKAV